MAMNTRAVKGPTLYECNGNEGYEMVTGTMHANARKALADIDFNISEMESIFSQRKDEAAKAAQ